MAVAVLVPDFALARMSGKTFLQLQQGLQTFAIRRIE